MTIFLFCVYLEIWSNDQIINLKEEFSLKKEELLAVLSAVAGTYLESVFKIMNSGQFAEDDLSAVKDGEVVVAGMTSFQKSLYSFLVQCTKELNSFGSFFKTLEKTEENKEIAKKKFMEVEAIRKDADDAGRLLWKSIESNPAVAGKSLGIRAGYVIVLLPENKEDANCDCPICQLGKIFGGLGKTSMVITLGSHKE